MQYRGPSKDPSAYLAPRARLAGTSAPLMAAPVLGKLALDGGAAASGDDHSRHLTTGTTMRATATRR